MFINVTRFGASKPLRLAIAAIAYVDDGPSSTAVIKLIGGEGLRTQEDRVAIEELIASSTFAATAVLVSGLDREMVAGDIGVVACADGAGHDAQTVRRGSRRRG